VAAGSGWGVNFAATKTQLPRPRDDLVARDALDERLRRALGEARVTLVCAPAGYGKTTALALHLARPGAPAWAWIACDEDDDLARFGACLVQALEPFDLPWRSSPEALAAALDGSDSTTRQRFAHELLHALAATDAARGLIVLDDLQRIADPAVFALLDSLTERLPPAWGLVLASRVEPPMALARWRVRGELAEIRQPELDFSLDEVRALLRRGPMRNAGPSEAEGGDRALELLERTGGWVTGLRLSLSGSPTLPQRSRSQRHLFDYLASEVLQQMAPALRSFLLRSALLRTLSVPACAALTGDARAAQHLAEIERLGLFASVVQDDPPLLRLHGLFRDFLEDRLRRELADDLPALLHRAAAIEPDLARRVTLLLAASDEAAAERALLRATPAMLLAGETAQALRQLTQFSVERQRQSPALAFVRGLCAWQRWDWARLHAAMAQATLPPSAPWLPQALALDAMALLAMNRLDEAGQRLARAQALPLDRDTEALTELVACWHASVCGPADGPAQHLTRMVALLSDGASAEAWYRCVPSISFMGRPGVTRAVQAFVDGAARVASDAHPPLMAAVHHLGAWVRLWRGQVDAAAAELRSAVDDSRWLGMPRHLHVGTGTVQMVLDAVRGDRDGFRARAATLLDDVQHDPERRGTWLGNYLVPVGWLATGLGDWPMLDQVNQTLARQPTADEWPWMMPARAMLQAMSALHEGRFRQVCETLEPCVDAADALGAQAIDQALRLTLARAQVACGRPREGWRTLAPVLARARASGEILALLCTGRAMLDALAQAPWGVDASREELAWLAHWATLCAPADAVVAPPPGGGHELRVARLSPRELEVLERIAAGDSNKLIARAFDLSPHTVKRHVANILDKIELSSRGQAAAWWQGLGQGLG